MARDHRYASLVLIVESYACMVLDPECLLCVYLCLVDLLCSAWLGTIGTHPLFWLVEFICMPNTNYDYVIHDIYFNIGFHF